MVKALRTASFVALLLTGCSQGAYPADIFPEMHHQASYRRLEPSRPAPPSGSVPTSGGQAAYTFDEARRLNNPIPDTPQSRQHAMELYAVNCAMCHGQSGRGDGVVERYFAQSGAVPPVDFTSQRVRRRSDAELWWLITNGIGGMPAFRGLLADEERWTVLYAIHVAQGS